MRIRRSAHGSSRRWVVAVACAAAALAPRAARAANPLNSSDQTTASAQAACTSGDRNEFNIVPIIGGTSDIGIGVGQFSDLARVSRGVRKNYVFRLNFDDSPFRHGLPRIQQDVMQHLRHLSGVDLGVA